MGSNHQPLRPGEDPHEHLAENFGSGEIDFDRLGDGWWGESGSEGEQPAATLRGVGARRAGQSDGGQNGRFRPTGSWLFAEELGELSCVSTGCWRAAGRLAGLDGGFVLADGGIFIACDWEGRVFTADSGSEPEAKPEPVANCLVALDVGGVAMPGGDRVFSGDLGPVHAGGAEVGEEFELAD